MTDVTEDRGPGRPPITELISEEKMMKAYEVSGSVRGAARKLGTTHRTVAKYLRKMGVDISKPEHWVFTERKKPLRYSKFAKWLRENQGELLPRSIAGMAELSGCSYQTVNCYMYRRRKRVRDLLDTCPDLVEAGILVEVSNMPDWKEGHKKPVINTRRFESYKYEIDSYTLEVKLVFDTKKYKKLVAHIPNAQRFVDYVVKHYIMD
jgi:hypothetical protein